MTENDYFSEIIAGANTEKEQITRILSARGVLLFEENEKLYLSDNAAIDDIAFLSEMFQTHQLGSINPIEGKDRLAEINISPRATVLNAIDFFKEQRHVSFPITEQSQPWWNLIKHSFASKVDLQVLEPFVARYVKAISACGVATNYSCDGNGPRQNCIDVRSPYPFNIWHRIIYQFIIPKEYSFASYISKNRLFFVQKNQFDCYLLINKAAEYLYNHRFAIREIKAKACSTITASNLKHLTNDEIEALFTSSVLREIKEQGVITL